MATTTQSLTKLYGSFFSSTIDFAICPYTLTYSAFAGKGTDRDYNPALGVFGCIFLSTVVPILPDLTLITLLGAAVMTSLAIASMFIAYPATIVIDAFNNLDATPSPSCAMA